MRRVCIISLFSLFVFPVSSGRADFRLYDDLSLVPLMYRRLPVFALRRRKLLSEPLYRTDAAVARKAGERITAVICELLLLRGGFMAVKDVATRERERERRRHTCVNYCRSYVPPRQPRGKKKFSSTTDLDDDRAKGKRNRLTL